MSTPKNDYGVNIILYPRAYNKRGGESLHSVQGMTSDGRIVNVKLRLSDEAMQKENYPSILEFSRTDAKALQSCFSSPENSPDNREGVLLFSQATSDGVNSQGMESYIAKWANVLAQQSESPEPIVGLGRVDIKKNVTLIKSLKEKLIIAKERNDNEAITKIESEISNPKNFSFSLISYHYESIVSAQSSQVNELKNKIIEAFGDNKIHGAVPGFFIRAINQDGRIVFGSYLEYFAKYNNLEEKYQSIVEMVDYFIDSVEPSLDFNYFNQSSLTIEVCPLSKVITGRVGKKHFGQEYKYSFLKRMFYSQSDTGSEETSDPMLCNLAAKITIYDDKSLLSRVYPISHQLGDPRRLDLHGRFTKIFDGEDAKLSQRPVSNDELTPRLIGSSYQNIPHRSTWIINGDSAPLLSFNHEEDKHQELLNPKKQEDPNTVELSETILEPVTIPLRDIESEGLTEASINEKESTLSYEDSNEFPEIDSFSWKEKELEDKSSYREIKDPPLEDFHEKEREGKEISSEEPEETSGDSVEAVEITQRWNNPGAASVEVSSFTDNKISSDEEDCSQDSNGNDSFNKDIEDTRSNPEDKLSGEGKKLTGMAAFMQRKKMMK